MRRLTITLPDETYRALRRAAAKSGKTMGQIVEESLGLYGIKTEQQLRAPIAGARQRANLSEEEALDIAVRETREQRNS